MSKIPDIWGDLTITEAYVKTERDEGWLAGRLHGFMKFKREARMMKPEAEGPLHVVVAPKDFLRSCFQKDAMAPEGARDWGAELWSPSPP